jgi:hypothetical protein
MIWNRIEQAQRQSDSDGGASAEEHAAFEEYATEVNS